ncbi:MAG: M56 family metallopeptidase [Fimbriimonas sp.]
MSELLVGTLLRSLALGALGLLFLGSVRRRSASVRHAVAALCLLAMPVLPVLSLVLPGPTLPVLSETPIPVIRLSDAVVPPSSPVPMPTPDSIRWAEVGVAIWAAGAGLLLLRYGFALGQVAGWVRRGRRIRSVVVESESVSIPITFWFGRHIVVLPAEWRSWTRERRRSVFRHELAHVRRGDWFVQSSALVVNALFWPNPFAWMLAKAVRSLSERAADDLVLDSGVAPSRYAQDLLEIAREAKAAIPAVALPMAFRADVARRIDMVLKTKVQRGRVTFAGLVGTGLLIAAVAVPVASWGLAPRVAPQPFAKPTDQEPAPVTVSVFLPKEGVGLNIPFKRLNLPSKQGRVKDASMGNVVAFALDQRLSDRILTEWAQSKSIDSAPVLRTLSGQSATIGVGQGDSKVGILPTKNPDGTTTLSARVRLEKSGKPPFQGGVELVLEKGVNSVMIVRTDGERVVDVLALVKVAAG